MVNIFDSTIKTKENNNILKSVVKGIVKKYSRISGLMSTHFYTKLVYP